MNQEKCSIGGKDPSTSPIFIETTKFLFPVLHWSTKSSENLTHQTQFGPSLLFNQGIYKEIKRVIPADVWLQRDCDPNVTLSNSSLSESASSLSFSASRKLTTWIIIGYKSLEKTLDSSLEATWKEWTGIRHVYLHLRSDFEIRKISFLHRVHPIDNLDLFMYIVLMEIGNVEDNNRIWLLDFVQRMRVERMKGFLTVYSQVEQEISSIDDEYRKYTNGSETSLQNPPPSLPPKLTRVTPLLETTLSSFVEMKSPPPISTALLDYHTSEINGNIKFMEKLLEEIHQQPIGDYF